MRLLIVGSAVLPGLLAVAAAADTSPAASKAPPYKAPAGDLKGELLWASQCEQPEGKGLAFSGQSQVSSDGWSEFSIVRGESSIDWFASVLVNADHQHKIRSR